MLVYKHRSRSLELQMMEALNLRMTFSYSEKIQLANQQNGHTGEVQFDGLLAQTSFNGIVLNDLSLNENGAFQLDALLLTGDRMILYDMKHYAGDYIYQDGKFHSKFDNEVNNPLVQWERHNSLLRQLGAKLGYRLPLESLVVFTNPSFFLYNAPKELPIVFPSQLPQHLEIMGAKKSFITERDQQFAQKLLLRHNPNLFPPRVPKYTFSSLKKGIPCRTCSSFELVEHGHSLICLDCGSRELKSQAVLRNIQVFQLLFPTEKLTTGTIYEWCAVIHSPQTIRSILKSSFQERGSNKGRYYE